MIVTIERNDQHATALAALPGPRRGIRPYVDYAMGVLPSSVPTKVVVSWLQAHGVEVSRQTVSGHLREWRKAHGVTTDTGGLPVLTDARLAELSEAEAAAMLPEPDDVDDSAPPAGDVSTTPQSVTPDAASEVTDTPNPATPVVSEPSPTPAADSPAASGAAIMSMFGTDAPTAAPSPLKGVPAFLAWVEARAVWVLYMGLISATAYGLYEVLAQVVGAPQVTALVAAVSVELVAIACKVLADGASRDGESDRVVAVLYVAAGAIAVLVAAANAWGHSKIEGDAPEVSAVLYASASIAGFVLATVATTLRSRARLRRQGRLESAGMVIPAYVHARYGAVVAERAGILSRVAPGWDLPRVVTAARREVAEEVAEAAEAARLVTLRAAVTAQAHTVHGDELAADFAAAQFSDRKLSDLMTADEAGHAAQADALRDWIASHRNVRTDTA